MRATAALAFVLVLVSGCGGQKAPRQYAGMSEWEVREHAMDSLFRELRSQSSDIYHHKVELQRQRTGINSSGEKAWVVEFVDHSAGEERYCLRLWARTALTIRNYDGEWTACDLDGDPPPDEDAGAGA